MKFTMTLKLAIRNLGANRILCVPFVLASSLMLALFYIMTSLVQNHFVQTRHPALPALMVMGVIIIGIFTTIFVLYADRFLIKRRNKEFALYGILGLNKRNIAAILLNEWLILFTVTILLSIGGGNLFGKLLFLLADRLVSQGGSAVHSDYVFEPLAALITLFFGGGLFFLAYLLNLTKVAVSTPIALLGASRKGEREPRTRWFLAVLGLLLLGAGYYLALTTRGSINSLLTFFLAALLVIGGTYFLYISFSIAVLKAARRGRRYYQSPSRFISVAGMMYRMKANAVGLASIAVLCTALLITLSTTLSIYTSLVDQVENAISWDNEVSLELTSEGRPDDATLQATIDQLEKKVRDVLVPGEKIKRSGVDVSFMLPVIRQENELLPVSHSEGKPIPWVWMTVETVKDYEQAHGMQLDVKPDEIYLATNDREMDKYSDLVLAGKSYRIRRLDETVTSTISVEHYNILVPDNRTFNELNKVYLRPARNNGTLNGPAYTRVPVQLTLGFDLEENQTKSAAPADGQQLDLQARLMRAFPEPEYSVRTRDGVTALLYQMDGGFLFLGIVIGTIFLIGTSLIIYYKQLSEGYEDREQFQIMKRVGLPDRLIRKTLSTQVLWMFLLPLLTALVHTLVASRILNGLLLLFGSIGWARQSLSLAIVTAAFVLVYGLIFKLTSGLYYKIVR